MKPASRLACAASATLAIMSLAVPLEAGAQFTCAPAGRVPEYSIYGQIAMDKRVSLHGREVSLRNALDRLSAAAGVRLSYSSELLDPSRPVCLEYESAPVGFILSHLLSGTNVRAVPVGADMIVLAPVSSRDGDQSESETAMLTVGLLNRVVVTGSTVGASHRNLPIALDIVDGKQLAMQGGGSMSGALDGIVPGLWLWEQSPLSLLARYGSIRGASSFGVSYPKVYVDGIEVANSLLVTHLDPESVSRIEVIRGPQGAALYGADAISGVMNIVTRQEGAENGTPRRQIRSEGGATSSDYSSGNVLTQSHAISLQSGTNVKSGRLGMTLTTIGPFLPGASSQQLAANGGLRFVGSRGVITGTLRMFAQDARTPASPVLAGIGMWSATAARAAPLRSSQFTGSPPDSVERRLDSLSRLLVLDSSDRQSVRQLTLGANATFAQSERWTHSFVTGLDGYRLRSASILDGAFPSALDSALRAATGNAVRTTLRASSVGQFGNHERAAVTVTFGAEHSIVRDESVTHELFTPQPPPGPSGPGKPSEPPSGAGFESPSKSVETRSNAGLIGQISGSLRDMLFVSGGVRVERNSGFGGQGDIATLPMLGAALVRPLGPGTFKLRAAYGKGIRPPGTSSRAGTLMGLTATLSPEEQSGIEAGVDFFLGSSFSLHATRFDQNASGLIQPVSVYSVAANDPMPRYRRIVYQLQNVGEISNRGWELQGLFGNGPLRFGATFSQVDSRVQKLASQYTGDLRAGNRMLEVPSMTLGANALYSRGRWNLSSRISRASNWINYDRIALLTAFTTEKNDIRQFVGPELRSYWRTYGGVTRIGGRMAVGIGKGMMFTVDGENLLNEQGGEPDNITVLPGRTISAGLRVGF